jgi:hypothetical protein
LKASLCYIARPYFKKQKQKNEKKTKGWEYNSGVEHLLSVCKALFNPQHWAEGVKGHLISNWNVCGGRTHIHYFTYYNLFRLFPNFSW